MNGIVLACTALLALPCADAKQHEGVEEVDQWVTYYYKDPRPEEVASALRALPTNGLFENDNAQAPLSGFFAEVFRANPDSIDAWAKPYIGIPSRHILYSALWAANSKESKAALEQMAQAAGLEEAETRELPMETLASIDSEKLKK